jgi:hypothetical protein
MEVVKVGGQLLIFTGPETDEQEFKRVIRENGVEGRTDYEILPLPEDGHELVVIQLC